MPFDQENFVLPAVETDDVLRDLIAARALLSDSARWGKKRGETACGEHADPRAAEAVRFCAVGALQRVGRDYPTSCYHRPDVKWLSNAAATLFPDSVEFGMERCVTVNDHRGHADALALFDRAIAARRAAIASSSA